MDRLCVKEASEIVEMSVSALYKDRCKKSHLYRRYNIPFHLCFGRIWYYEKELKQWKQQYKK